VPGEDASNVIRFGVFEVDLRAGELRRQGLKVKLQEQPFQVLAMLLEKQGQVVTREELRDRIWPDGIFVDFDKSLSKAVNKVREALGDSPENSCFVETLPRRGYRFLVPVESGQAPQRPVLQLPSLPAEWKPGPSARRRFERAFRGIMATLAIAVVVGVGVWVSMKPPIQQPGQSALIAIPLTTFPGDQFFPNFSPDGNQVAFAWNGPKQDNVDIYVKLIGTDSLLQLTNDPAMDYAPAWSPDGRYIAFLRGGDHATVLLVPSIGGPPERKLTETTSSIDFNRVGGSVPGLSWSPDAKWIAMRDHGPGEAQESIYLFSMDTGEKRRLTFPPPGCGDGTPAFSPDGRRLAFSRTSTVGVSQVYLLDLSERLFPERPAKQLTLRKQSTVGLAWTPDGREIIYSSGSYWAGGSVELWRISASGSGEPRVLALAGEHGWWPAISRRGNHLAFARNHANDQNIWRLDLSGPNGKAGKPFKLIASTRNDYNPQYSPDGKKIAFISQRSGGDEVWVCNSNGADAVQLTSLRAAITGCPRWSPDGARIVFDSNAAGAFDVYVIDATGGRPKRLTNHPADDAVASWSRSGQSIYFVSNRTKTWEIWKMRADGSEAVQVTRNGGYVAFESVDGAFIYYTKRLDGGKLWRVPLRGGEETQVLDAVDGITFAVLDKGIYFSQSHEAGSNCTLRFLSFKTGAVKIIATIPHLIDGGLSVSPDGRYAVYTQEDQEPGSDLMLVENFR
jgi:Tol biopolymer transport system component/DNA-binding winged helix-turn-helix (wHTH) protein